MQARNSISVPSFAFSFKVFSGAVFGIASLSLLAYLFVMLGKVSQ